MLLALSQQPESFDAEGLHFRGWTADDVLTLVHLFDTDQMDRWTPLPHPFTEEVARSYVLTAAEARQRGILQFAVCRDASGPALGELLIFSGDLRDEVELAYAVGVEHQRQAIGTRAVKAGLGIATAVGARRAVLSIAADNHASRATAVAAGFALTPAPQRERRRKGYVLMLETWERHL